MPEKKPYELKDLGEKIIAKAKEDGLEIAEEAVEKLAKAAYYGTKEWFAESAALSQTKVDDIMVPFVNFADSIVIPQIEKIDLNQDGK